MTEDVTEGVLARHGAFKFPEEARAIGLLIIECANLDMVVPELVANILECSVEDTHTMLRQVDNTSTKLAITKELAERYPDRIASKAFLANLGPIEEGLSLRNSLAHGLYFHTTKGTLMLLTGATQGRRGKPKDELVDAAKIEAAARGIVSAVDAITALAPVPFGQVSYQRSTPQPKRDPSSPPKERRLKDRKLRKLQRQRPPSAG